jgi:hypothetical protein
MGVVFFAAVAAAGAGDGEPGEWGKALVFEPRVYARGVPGGNSGLPTSPPLEAAQIEAVRPIVAALAAARSDEVAGGGTGLDKTVAVSRGEFPSPTGPGRQFSGTMPAETVRREMGACKAAAPESLGADAKTGRTFVMVRLDCPEASRAEWRRPYAAIVLRNGKVDRLTVNIGDLPNMRMAPPNGKIDR